MIRRCLSFAVLLFSFIQLGAQDSTFLITMKSWNLKVVGLDPIYPTYLADPLGVRFEGASMWMKYADYDPFDAINTGGSYKGHMSVMPAARLSLLQFRPHKNPGIGFEGEFGVMTPSHMRHNNNDLIGLDGIFYFAIAGNPTEWLYLRISKHHICTHIGDEFPKQPALSVVDRDPMFRQGPVLDDFRFAAALRPLHFLGKPELNVLLVYAEMGFFKPGLDFLGWRSSWPNKFAYMNYQGGAELEYYFNRPSTWLGGIFTGINFSTFQQNGYAINMNYTAGYIFPQERNKRRLRIGFQYYNGRSLVNEFYNRREKFIGLFLAFDV